MCACIFVQVKDCPKTYVDEEERTGSMTDQQHHLHRNLTHLSRFAFVSSDFPLVPI